MIRRLLGFLLLLIAALPGIAEAQAPAFPTNWRWVVGDQSAPNNIWNGATGALESNASADYQAWVGGLVPIASLGPNASAYAASISASANNGSGLIRLTVSNTVSFATGNVLAVNGTGTSADGTWTVTVIDATCTSSCRVDLQGSSFSGGSATTGILGEGTPIDTLAHLLAFINQTNAQSLITASFYGYNPISALSSVTLTNPMVSNQVAVFSLPPGTVVLPQMNLFGSIPIGVPFFVTNNSIIPPNAGTLGIYAQDGTTPIITNVQPGQTIELVLQNNSSKNGAFLPPIILNRNIYSLTDASASRTYSGTEQFRLLRRTNAGAMTDTLQVYPPPGTWIDIENAGGGIDTISASAGQNIDGSPSIQLAPGQGVRLVISVDGGAWYSYRGMGLSPGYGLSTSGGLMTSPWTASSVHWQNGGM